MNPGAGAGAADWWPPASVRDLLRTRLQAVSEPTRQMLTAAAVLGSDNDADLLRAVSGRGEDEIVEAIDEALARSLLTEIPPPAPHQAPSYGFPYEALRRTAYESATLARRRLLHGRAADVLTRRHERDPATTPAATVAGHLQLAGRDEEAARGGGEPPSVARELYAHAEAHAHLAKALALGYPQLPGADRPRRRAGRARPVPRGAGRVRDRRGHRRRRRPGHPGGDRAQARRRAPPAGRLGPSRCAPGRW